MIRENRGGLFAALATALAVCAGPYACSSSGALSGLGGPCSQFSDCQQDLICGKGPNGTRVCTDDPSGLQPPQGKDAGVRQMMPGEDASAAEDVSAPMGDARAPEAASPTPDAEVRDAGRPVDSGRVEDTGKLEDTGTLPEASPAAEAGGTDAATE